MQHIPIGMAADPVPLLLTGARIAAASGEHDDPAWTGALAAIRIDGGRIAAIDRPITHAAKPGQLGPGQLGPGQFGQARIDLQGRLVTPALLEPAAVLAYLPATASLDMVAATEAADEEALFAAAAPRLGALIGGGVGAVGMATLPGSGVEARLRQLRVARAMPALYPVTVRALLSLDGSAADAESLEAARQAGLVDGTLQMDGGLARLVTEDGVASIQLPAAWLAHGAGVVPEAGCLSGGGNPVALPSALPLTVMTLAARMGGYSWQRALAGMTVDAAAALGLGADAGRFAVGAPASLAIWALDRPEALCDWLSGASPLVGLLIDGRWAVPYRPRLPG